MIKANYRAIHELKEWGNRFRHNLAYNRLPSFRILKTCGEANAYVSYKAYAGLGNRIRAHYTATLLARRLERAVHVAWLPSPHLQSDGSDIFASGSSLPSGPGRISRIRTLSLSDLHGRLMRDDLKMLRDSAVVLDYDCQWNPLDSPVNRLLGSGDCTIAVRQEILDEAAAIAAALPRPVLGMHIRRGDFAMYALSSSDDYYVDAIRAIGGADAYSSILVATDEDGPLDNRIAAGFQAHRVLVPLVGRDSLGVAPEALAHLLALARTDAFIGTPKSSFSELIEAIRDKKLNFVHP